MPTWKKLSGFLLTVFILMGMLAIFSDLFLIPIQTFMVESIRSTNFRLPEAGTLPDRNTAEIRQYMRNSLEQEDWPERRTVVIDLDTTSARLDFSFWVKEDHEIATVIRSGIAARSLEPWWKWCLATGM